MARRPSVSANAGVMVRASWAAVWTKPSSFAVEDSGSSRLKSAWLSFQDGLGFSMHMETMGNEPTLGLLLSLMQSLGGKGNPGSQPRFVGTGPFNGGMPDAGLNCGNPSNCWSVIPLAAQ